MTLSFSISVHGHGESEAFQHSRQKALPGPPSGANEQLHFAFFTQTEAGPAPDRAAQLPGSESELEHLLGAARNALLKASAKELNAALPLLLEFYEASLTRALDLVRRRAGVNFSDEEYRSLRGIGQARRLLVTRQQGQD